MNNLSINEISPLVGNPSPEVDRGTTFEIEELTHLSLDGTKTIPYGYYEIIRKKKNVCKNLEMHELAVVRCPHTATCDTKEVAEKRARLVLLCRRTNVEKRRAPGPQVDPNEIEEQGGPTNAAIDKMIAKARITQRLSDNHVGGGLGKTKRLNRLIAQGSHRRYSGAKKQCPKRIEDDLARKSSEVARESSRSSMRDIKNCIEEQSGPTKEELFLEVVNRVTSIAINDSIPLEDRIESMTEVTGLNFQQNISFIASMPLSKIENMIHQVIPLLIHSSEPVSNADFLISGMITTMVSVFGQPAIESILVNYQCPKCHIYPMTGSHPTVHCCDRIREQGYFDIPKVPVEIGTETIGVLNTLMQTLSEKKVELSDEATSTIHHLADSVREAANPNITHSFALPAIPGSVTSPEMRVFWTGGLLMLTFAALKNRSLLKTLLSVTAVAALWLPTWSSEARSYFDQIISWARERLNFYDSQSSMVEVDIVEHSGPIEEQGITSSVIDCIIGFMYFTCFRSLNWQKDPLSKLSAFFERTNDMRKNRNGLEFTFSGLLSYVQVFLDWICERFGWSKYNVAMDNRPEITLFAEKVTAELKLFSEGKILNAESAAHVMGLYTQGSKIAKALPSSIEYQDSRRLLQLSMSELTPLVMKIRRSNLHNMGPRIQPLGIILTGPSGVGKTTALTPMMLAVTANVLEPDQRDAFLANHNDFIYNRISENEYYDSYHGQMNVIHDDFGQQKDTEGVTQNQYMEVIRMVNANAMDLHMAHLDDKGLTNFRSKLVWATSNVNRFRLKSIVDTKAVARRFTCSYVVFPAPGYRADESETDIWKMALKKDLSGDFFDDETFPHLQFMLYDLYDGKTIGHETYTMEQVIDQITNAYELTQVTGQRILDTQSAFKAKYMARRFPSKELREEGASMCKQWPIFPNENMTSYVQRLMKIDQFDYEFKRQKKLRASFLEELDCVAESLSAKTKLELLIDEYKAKVYSAYCSAYDTVSTMKFANLMKTALVGLATLTTGFGLYKMFSSSEELDDQNGDYAHKRRPQTKPTLAAKNRKSFVRHAWKGGKQVQSGIEAQLSYDATCDDIIYKIFKKNVYVMHLTTTSERMGCVTFIGGHDAFMPRHFAENVMSKIHDGVLSSDITIVLRAASNPDLYFQFAWKDIKWFFPDQWEDEDVVFARFPNVMPQAPNIRKYIMDDSEVISQRFSGKMLMTDHHGTLTVPFTHMYPTKDLLYTNYINPVGYEYDIPTKVGHCGNLIFVSNPLTGTNKLIGFHVAGKPSDGKGFSTRMTLALVKAYDEFANAGDEPYREEGAFIAPFTSEVVKPESFKTLYKKRKCRVPDETSIVPTPLYNTYAPPKCAPAKLKEFWDEEGVLIDPWLKARAKYARPSVYMDNQVLELCAASYGSMITQRSTDDAPWSKKVFSFEDAVRGVPGVVNCEGIPRSTSAGYPFNLDTPPGYKYKHHFFGQEGDYEFTSEYCVKLKHRVNEIIAEASKGNRLEHVYLDFLKDERRPLEKVASGSSRLISACPVDLLIAIRMYFLDFMRWFMTNRIVNGSAVGVNVFSEEWAVLRRHLQGNSLDKNIIAGDFSAYDASQTRQIMMQFLKFVNSWYNDGNDRIRAVLFEDICNSKHIFKDLVYEWPGGNPSGNPLTTILNTFNNNVLLRYAGIMAHDEYHYGPGLHIVSKEDKICAILVSMEFALFIVAYGDDNAISVGKPLRLWYNQHSLTRAFAKIGFTYTSEAKDGVDVEPLRSIDDIAFLKRKWKYDPIPGRYVSALEMDTILESPQWTKKKDKDFNDVRKNVDTVLKELSAHGDVVWDHWFPKIVQASQRKLDYIPPIPNRRNALALQLSRTDYDC